MGYAGRNKKRVELQLDSNLYLTYCKHLYEEGVASPNKVVAKLVEDAMKDYLRLKQEKSQ